MCYPNISQSYGRAYIYYSLTKILYFNYTLNKKGEKIMNNLEELISKDLLKMKREEQLVTQKLTLMAELTFTTLKVRSNILTNAVQMELLPNIPKPVKN